MTLFIPLPLSSRIPSLHQAHTILTPVSFFFAQSYLLLLLNYSKGLTLNPHKIIVKNFIKNQTILKGFSALLVTRIAPSALSVLLEFAENLMGYFPTVKSRSNAYDTARSAMK